MKACLLCAAERADLHSEHRMSTCTEPHKPLLPANDHTLLCSSCRPHHGHLAACYGSSACRCWKCSPPPLGPSGLGPPLVWPPSSTSQPLLSYSGQCWNSCSGRLAVPTSHRRNARPGPPARPGIRRRRATWAAAQTGPHPHPSASAAAKGEKRRIGNVGAANGGRSRAPMALDGPKRPSPVPACRQFVLSVRNPALALGSRPGRKQQQKVSP